MGPTAQCIKEHIPRGCLSEHYLVVTVAAAATATNAVTTLTM